MTAQPPVVEWRSASSPGTVLTQVGLVGGGFNGAIPLGTNSTPVTIRVYNNYLAAANIADATSCVLACYDDTIHQGQATSAAVINQYLQVQVTDYNGASTGGDTQFFGIGGQTKHPLPVNGGTLGGAVANYATVILQAVVPTSAVQGQVVEGLWLEFSSSA